MGEAVLSPVRRAVAVAALALAASGPGRAVADDEIVRRVSVRSETPVPLDEVRMLIALRPGEPLSERLVRRTLRTLRRSGIAAEVEIWRRPVPGGVEAIVVLRPDVRVVAVEIEGQTGLKLERLRPLLEQHPGQPLREDRLLRGDYQLLEKLQNEGYLDASVRLDVAPGAGGTARVTYQVEAGERTTIERVSVAGLPEGVPEAEALEALEAVPGEPFRAEVIHDDAERLQRFLIERRYRLASVEPAAVEPGAMPRTRQVRWRVEPGPLVELELVGVERKPLERRDLLPFLGDGGYDEALLQQSIGLIRADFQSRGYYDVEVESSEQRSEDRLRIRIEVRPGSRWTLEEIDFVGNEGIADAELARRMETAPRRLLTPGSGRLVDEVLAEDLSNLRSFYALSGYDRASLGPPRVEREGSELRLVIPIEEGPKHSVADVEIAGLESLDPTEMLAAIPLRAGGPYHRLLLEASAERIRSALEEAGYRSAIVSPEVEWSSDRLVASVRFQVLEGDRSTVRAILLRGNTRTKSLVLRRFLGLDLGEPISITSLLDVQRRLYRLGVFSRVEVRSPGTLGGASSHEVLVDVEEGRTRAVAYGLGYDTEAGARGLLRLSESNLFGRLIRLQGDAIVSQREEVFRVLAQQPYLGRRLVDVSALAFSERENRTSFDVGRRGLQLGLARSYDWGRAGIFYSYRIVELETDQPVNAIPRESLNARVASLTPTVLLDHRDDPIDPTRGWSFQAQMERAFPVLAADAEFHKLFVQGSAYVPIGRLGGLAFAARAGAIDPIASAQEPGLDPIDAVPAAELFYAGGRTSHRAFERDLLGIPGETLFLEEGQDPYPLGGGGLALVNLEWRFPIAGPVGGTLFADGGNVWREARDFDPADARWGVGVGVRYLSPVGPLRLEIGWKLDRQPWEDPYVWFLSLGNPF